MLKRNKKILYAGHIFKGSTTCQRINSLKIIEQDVVTINLNEKQIKMLYLLKRVQGKLFRYGLNGFGLVDMAGVNKKIINYAYGDKYDIFWIEKGLTIKASTLKLFKNIQPECQIVGFSLDDMSARHCQSDHFLKHLNYYDIFFTNKSYGVNELKELGIKRVKFIGNSYDAKLHKPVELSREERNRLGGSVGFIGTAEPQRVNSISFLDSNNINIKLWGDEWNKYNKVFTKNVYIAGPSQYAEKYVKIINSFDINLCFLRKINRDLQTTRSIEIPACGAFMLAERTDEHLELFEEGKEVECFDSDEEMLDKIKYYLKNEWKRKKIAAAGRERCIKSSYSNHGRMQQMLNTIQNL